MCVKGYLSLLRGPKPRMGIYVEGMLVAVEAYCGEYLVRPGIDIIYKCPVGTPPRGLVPFVVRPPVPPVPRVAVPLYLLHEVRQETFVYAYDPRLLVTPRGVEALRVHAYRENCVLVA